jgi:hypothetical protein
MIDLPLRSCSLVIPQTRGDDARLLGLRLEIGGNAERLPHSVGLDARALGVADGTHRVAAKQ